MPKLIDLTGKRFGRWVVVRRVFSDTYKRGLYECLCECGKTKIVKADILSRGKSQSCGCLHRELSRTFAKKQFTTHGMSRSLTYNSWRSMVQRCTQESHPDFKPYRKFEPCEFLRASLENFISVVGIRASKFMTIDRINTRDGYHCGKCDQCKKNGWELNVRWNTPEGQARNKTSNRYITIEGVSWLAQDLANKLGVSEWMIRTVFLKRQTSCATANSQ